MKLWRCLLCGLAIAAVIADTSCCPAGEVTQADKPYPPLLPASSNRAQPTDDQKLWALGTCAVLNEMNGASHDLLGGEERTPDSITGTQSLLEEWWGIRNRQDLLVRLRWIETGGQRREFDTMTGGSGAALVARVAAVYGDSEARNQITIAQKYGPKFAGKSLVGWDYSRYVALCGWGYVAGYLGEDEAWQRIMPAARLMQKTFNSWKELGENYLIGREFWSVRQTQQNGAAARRAQERLLTDPVSPWVRLPWKLDLSASRARSEKSSSQSKSSGSADEAGRRAVMGKPFRIGNAEINVLRLAKTDWVGSVHLISSDEIRVVSLSVRNVSKRKLRVDADDFKLVASDGAEYSVDSGSMDFLKLGESIILGAIGPGSTKAGNLVFMVPVGAKIRAVRVIGGMSEQAVDCRVK